MFVLQLDCTWTCLALHYQKFGSLLASGCQVVYYEPSPAGVVPEPKYFCFRVLTTKYKTCRQQKIPSVLEIVLVTNIGQFVLVYNVSSDKNHHKTRFPFPLQLQKYCSEVINLLEKQADNTLYKWRLLFLSCMNQQMLWLKLSFLR